MMSCLLFHGPGARQRALDEAGSRGRLLHEPFGDSGLKVDEARLFVNLLYTPPIGTDVGVLIAGPMDKAAPKSSDVLLKSIEEFGEYVFPILWATDLGGVRGTIRSRCLPVWSPPTGFEPEDPELEEAAQELVQAVLTGKPYMVPPVVQKMKGREHELLMAACEGMAAMSSVPSILAQWEKVREAARWRNPTPLEVIAAFMPVETT